MCAVTEEDWQKAFKSVREQFEIDNLLPEQKKTHFAYFVEVKIFL